MSRYFGILIFMNWGLKRQILYASVIFGLIVFVILFLIIRHQSRQVSTCFDNEQNQDERGVDCGGVCSLVCTSDAQPIAMLWQRALPVTADVYNVIAYVQNTNVAASAQNVPYTFLVYDKDNILITERSGVAIIPPNQRIAIFESGVKVGNRTPALIDFRFDEKPTWFRSQERFATQNIITSSITWERQNTSPTLRADIMNTATFDMYNVRAVAIAYNAQGNAFAVSQTLVDVIPQGMRERITFTWPTSFAESVVRTEIVTHIDPFNQPEF